MTFRNRSRALVLLAICLAACSCARTALPLSPAEQQAIATSERLGVAIYAQDRAASQATGALRAHGYAPPVEGWIAVDAGSRDALVRFVGACGEAVCALADVEVGGPLGPRVLEQPPVPLPSDQLAMWSARQLALGSGFRSCTESYSAVVLASTRGGQPAWDVYLLAASEDENVVLLTGHHRVTVSADGTRILETKSFSEACVPLTRRAPDGAKPAAALVMHIVDPYPVETHVYTNLTYRLPLYVGTQTGTFAIEDGKIRLVERRAP